MSNKSKKKPVILYLVDAITDPMLDGIEDMTEEDIKLDRKFANATLAFALSLPPYLSHYHFSAWQGLARDY